MATHKGSELNNVNETWNRNERLRQQGSDTDKGSRPPAISTISNDLEQTIREEAAEYDNSDKEERLLDGERATVKDDATE